MGWKLGMGRRERIGEHIAVGFLTTDTLVQGNGASLVAAVQDGDLHFDVEVCVELGSDLDRLPDTEAVRSAIAHCWPALEIVDLAQRAGEPDSIVVDNVFHRAVAFGDTPIPLDSPQQVVAYVNGERRDRAPWPADIPERIMTAVAILTALDQRMRAGERIITGSIVQVLIAIGDRLRADFGDHASIAMNVVAESGQR